MSGLGAGLAVFKLGERLLGVRAALSRAWAWITASSTHLLMAALAVSLVWVGFERHGKHSAQAALTAEKNDRKAADAKWAYADRINHRSIDVLIATVAKQNAAVQSWADTATARQKAASKALEAATERGKATEALADRIDAERAQGTPAGKECRSGAAVLAARGSL